MTKSLDKSEFVLFSIESVVVLQLEVKNEFANLHFCNYRK